MDLFHSNKLNSKKPSAGKILIAEPFMGDANFLRSVVFLCEFGDEGTVGFVLNRPTDLSLGDLLPELYSTHALQVYQGGPVQMDTLHMLHRAPQVFGGLEVAPGVYWGGSYPALQDAIHSDAFDENDVKLFVGYSGWSPGQLEKEMNEGSWLVGEPDLDILFAHNTAELWKRSVRHLGKDYAHLANMPINPQLN